MYPKNSFIVRNGFRMKILEEVGIIRFTSRGEGEHPNWKEKTEGFYTVDELKSAGWQEETE